MILISCRVPYAQTIATRSRFLSVIARSETIVLPSGYFTDRALLLRVVCSHLPAASRVFDVALGRIVGARTFCASLLLSIWSCQGLAVLCCAKLMPC